MNATVVIPSELRNRLKAKAIKDGQKISALVTQLLETGLKKEKAK